MAISLVGVFGETVEVELDLSFFSTENKIKKENGNFMLADITTSINLLPGRENLY